MNVVCAYLRMPFPHTPATPGDNASKDERERHAERIRAYHEERQVRVTALRILHRHRRFNQKDNPLFWSPITIDLAGANLTFANLTRADLTYANLTRADLTYANLTGTDLTPADVTDARGVRRDNS